MWPADEDLDRARGLVGDAEHPREVVAAAAGDDPQRRVGAGQRAADRAEQAVAAHHDRHLAGFGGAQRLPTAVLDARGLLDPEDDAPRVELGLDLGQQLQRPAAARGRVDEQGQRLSLDPHGAGRA